MKLLIDADGCPVVDLTVRLAREFGVKCLILCDTAHVFQKEGAETLTVSKGADSVDFALVNRVEPGDIAVTQDYGLAAMCGEKSASAQSGRASLYRGKHWGAAAVPLCSPKNQTFGRQTERAQKAYFRAGCRL